jgi:hypothetical protein
MQGGFVLQKQTDTNTRVLILLYMCHDTTLYVSSLLHTIIAYVPVIAGLRFGGCVLFVCVCVRERVCVCGYGFMQACVCTTIYVST